MFELDKYERRRHSRPPSLPTARPEQPKPVSHLSLLVWGEHCIECAAPACFSTCDLYERRPDNRCRRFEYGIYRNTSFKGFRGYGAEVAFKKWGKLESCGNAQLMPVKRTMRLEALLRVGVLASNVVGKVVYRLSNDIRWSYLAVSLVERFLRRLHRRADPTKRPDAFVLEVDNPETEPVNVHLIMRAAKGGPVVALPRRLPAFSTVVALSPGYSRHEFPSDLFSAVMDCPAFDIAIVPEGDTNPRLVFLTADFVSFAQTARDHATPIKCIVWDLDETLWDGILLETDDVRPRQHLVEVIRQSDERGILHSIASKNDYDHAWRKLTDLGLEEYFLFPRINWSSKVQSLRQIAEDLNIGLDTFAFVDDNEFELAQVREALPEVTCINVRDWAMITRDERFKGSGTAEAKGRRQLYRESIRRESARGQFGADDTSFLRSCEIVLNVRRFQRADEERVEDLLQRTNQLNFSGRKYKRHEIRPVLDDDTLEKYVLDCSDKYGSYGSVGFAIVRRGAAEITVVDFMLSCRVQGKFVEQAFFAFLTVTHPGRNAKLLRVNYRPTERNTPAAQVLRILKFVEAASGAGLTLELESHDLACDFIATFADGRRVGNSADAQGAPALA